MRGFISAVRDLWPVALAGSLIVLVFWLIAVEAAWWIR
jgi:hypothetical protein